MKEHNLTRHSAKAATCTDYGWNTYYECEDCDYTTYNRINPLGHRPVKDAGIPATCTSTGLTDGSHCSTCGVTLVTRVTTPKIDHSLDYNPSRTATCTENGWDAYYTCRYCNYTTFESIPALGHSVVVDEAVPSTCTTNGLTEGSHCDVCDEILEEQVVTNKIAHHFGFWAVEIYATATTNGRYVRECTACHHKEYAVIAAYGDRDIANIEADTTNGKATVDADSIQDAIQDVKETGKKEIIVNADSANNVTIDTSSLQGIVDVDSALTINTSNVHATFDKDALNAIMSSSNGEASIEFDIKLVNDDYLNDAQKVSLEDKKVAHVISAQVICGEATISDFGSGKVEVRIPFAIQNGKSAEDYKILYIADDGSIEELATTYVDGELVVELEHFSEYVIVDVSDNTNAIIGFIVLFAPFVVLSIVVIVDCIIKLRTARKHNED